MLKKVVLELARTHDFPEGSAECGYEIYMPLDKDGHIDAENWKKQAEKCTVRRFWEDEDDLNGHLVHHRGNVWAISYDKNVHDEERLFRFDKHIFVEGEYVAVTPDEDENPLPFKIVSVS